MNLIKLLKSDSHSQRDGDIRSPYIKIRKWRDTKMAHVKKKHKIGANCNKGKDENGTIDRGPMVY